VHPVGFIIRIYYDAPPYECQTVEKLHGIFLTLHVHLGAVAHVTTARIPVLKNRRRLMERQIRSVHEPQEGGTHKDGVTDRQSV
jgi:hypothetical protein